MTVRKHERDSRAITTALPPDPHGKWRIVLAAFGMLLVVTGAAGYGWATKDFDVLKTVILSILGAVVGMLVSKRE